jgi:putative glutamine amidotransferase
VPTADELPPRIGISTYREKARWGLWDERADVLPASYSDLVIRAGGAPMLLPPAGDARTARAVLSGVDGLLLAGGADIDPARYGAVRGPHTDTPRTDRDEWELTLAAEARRRELPILGICRGMQLLNVALGGSLTQHLPDVVGSELHCPNEGQFGHHTVTLAPDGRVAGALAALDATSLDLATHHHQGIERLAEGLVPVAWAQDGLIEAFEAREGGWLAGVQWHPEASHDDVPDGATELRNDAAGLALLRSFVAACLGAAVPQLPAAVPQ